MKISVIIPAYNASKTLDAAIASCLEQSYPPYEIIVVDDGSTDNTINITQKYPGVTLIPLSHNSGPSTARNTGWAAATGEVIAFLDSDDTWLTNKLAVINDVFSKNSKIQLLGHDYNVQDAAKESTQGNEPMQKNYLSILLKNPYQPSCMAIRANLPIRFNEAFWHCEDHEIATRIAHSHPCYFLATQLTILGRPQLTTGGASGNVWKMRKGELRLYSLIYQHNLLYTPIIPLLWIFSLGKMGFRQMFR